MLTRGDGHGQEDELFSSEEDDGSVAIDDTAAFDAIAPGDQDEDEEFQDGGALLTSSAPAPSLLSPLSSLPALLPRPPDIWSVFPLSL